ncbi:MAG: hypothetical protein DRJ15_16540 [Bacteroidetes bacterium]|nr:MAG: hypothetical protein DRJ15_16540 [Bacteroidota bacterium]
MATGDLNEALNVVGNLGKSLRKSTQQYSDYIDKLTEGKSTATDRRELREQERSVKALVKTSDALEKLYDKTTDLQKEKENGLKSTKKTSKELKKLAKDLHKVSPKTFTKEMVKDFEKVGDDVTSVNSAFGILRHEIDKNSKTTKKQTVVDANALKLAHKRQNASKVWVAAIKNSTAKWFSFDKGIDLVTIALIRSFKQIEQAQMHQVGMYSMVSDGLGTLAYSLSLAPEEMQKFVINNKTIMLSMQEDYTNLKDAVGKTTAMMTK